MARWERRREKLKVRKNRMRKSGASARTLQQIIVRRSEALKKGEASEQQPRPKFRKKQSGFIFFLSELDYWG